MAEAPEHSFLSQKFLDILHGFSGLQLYGYTEAERKKFDFACDIHRDWRRVLVGQTLWKHDEGIDKDIRSLLTKSEADILAYVIRDNVKNRNAFSEAMQDFRNIGYGDQLFRLKPFWIPNDFDADSDQARKVVEDSLKMAVVQDILFNVIFGNLAVNDIRFFLGLPGIPGLNLAILYKIATLGFTSYSLLSKELKVSINPVREKVLMLEGCGLVSRSGLGSPYISLKGRVFLELLRRLLIEVSDNNSLTPELRYILTWLDIEPVGLNNLIYLLEWPLRGEYDGPALLQSVVADIREWACQNARDWSSQTEYNFLMRSQVANAWEWPTQVAFARLLNTINHVKREWDIDLRRIRYKLHGWETDPRFPWEKNLQLTID